MLGSIPPRWRKVLTWAAGLVAAYALAGFLLLPPIARSVLAKRLTQELRRPVSIEKIRFNPFTLAATAKGVHVQDKDQETLASWERLEVNLQLSSLFRRGWVFHELALQSPYVRLQLQPDGSFTFADLLVSTNPPPSTPAEPFVVRLAHFQITNAQVRFVDLMPATPFTNLLGPFQLGIKDLITSPDAPSSYAFSGKTGAGESIGFQGTLLFHPFRARGGFDITGIVLTNYAPYYEDRVRFALRDGTFDTHIEYAIGFGGTPNYLLLTNASANLRSLAIAEPNSPSNTIRIADIALDSFWLDVLGRALHVGRFSSRDGQIHAGRSADGTLNLAELFATLPQGPQGAAAPRPPPATAPPAPAPWHVSVGELALTNYVCRFTDLSLPRPVEVLAHLQSFQARGWSTEPDNLAHVAAALQFGTNAALQANGTFAPRALELAVQLNEASLQPFDRYLDPVLNARIGDGQLHLRGNLTLPLNEARGPSYSGDVVLSNFVAFSLPRGLPETATNSGDPLARFQSLALTNLQFQLAPLEVALQELILSKPQLVLRRDASTNNWSGLVKPTDSSPNPAPVSPADPSAATAPPMNVRVESLIVTNGQVRWADQSNESPVELDLNELVFVLGNLATAPGTNISVQLAGLLNTNAILQTTGMVDLQSRAAQLDVALKSIPLGVFSPYLSPYLNLEIQSGALDLAGQVSAAAPLHEAVEGGFVGQLELAGLRGVETVLGEELVRWSRLRLTDIDFQLRPLSISADEVGWNELAIALVTTAETNNVSGIARATEEPPVGGPPGGPGAAPIPERTTPQTESPEIRIGRISLTNSSVRISDRALTPPVEVAFQQMNGALTGFSSQPTEPAQIAVTGNVTPSAAFHISGHVTPMVADKNTKVTIQFDQVPLNRFSPYSGKYLGHQLDSGQVNLDLDIAIQERQLQSENVMLLDQLTFGQSVPSPDAVNAPVKLAVALLKDPQGQIKIDLPVSGNLDDPEFRYGRVIWRGILNLLLKAATSPFALLGRVAGGSGETDELGYYDFQPGSAQLADPAKLDTLAKALTDRPQLSLEISGGADPALDGPALQRTILFERLRPAEQGESWPFTLENYTNLLRQTFLATATTNAPLTLTNVSPTPSTEPLPPLPAPPSNLKGAELLIRFPRPRHTPPPKTEPAPEIVSRQPTTMASEPPSFAEIEATLLKDVAMDQDALDTLAATRAKTVRDYLQQAGIDPPRLILTPTNGPPSIRAVFGLR